MFAYSRRRLRTKTAQAVINKGRTMLNITTLSQKRKVPIDGATRPTKKSKSGPLADKPANYEELPVVTLFMEQAKTGNMRGYLRGQVQTEQVHPAPHPK